MINDYRDSFSFIEYKSYGDGRMEIFDASYTNGQEPDDGGDIGVFLNYKLVGRFKAKSEAVSMLLKLISEAPAGDCRKFFNENKEVLFKNLC